MLFCMLKTQLDYEKSLVLSLVRRLTIIISGCGDSWSTLPSHCLTHCGLMLFKTWMEQAKSFPHSPPSPRLCPWPLLLPSLGQPPVPRVRWGKGDQFREEVIPPGAEATRSQLGYGSPPPSTTEVTWRARCALLRRLPKSLLPTRAWQTPRAAGGAGEGRGDRQRCGTSPSKASPAHQSQLSYPCMDRSLQGLHQELSLCHFVGIHSVSLMSN